MATVNVNVATHTLTEYSAVVNAEIAFTVKSAVLNLIEHAANVNASINTTVTATVDTLTFTEYNPTVDVAHSVSTTVDALVLTEYAATVNAEVSFTTGVGALTLTTYPVAAGFLYTTTFTQGLGQSFSSDGIYSRIIIEGINVTETNTPVATLIITDGIYINAPATIDTILNIIESIEMTPTLSSSAVLSKVVEDIMNMGDMANVTFLHSITEDITVDEVVVNLLEYLKTILETVNITDTLSDILTGTTLITEDITISESAEKFFLQLILEAIEATETLTHVAAFQTLATDDVTVSETASNLLTLTMVVEEGVTVDETLSANYIGQVLVIDGAKFFVNLDFANQTYSGWVINPENYAVSNYDFSFTDSAEFDGKYLFTDSSGLYELGGSLDETTYIPSSITTAALNFGVTSDKQVPEVLLGVAGDKFILRVDVDDEHTAYYELDHTATGLRTKQIKIGKGLIGKNWQFQLQTVDESALALNSMEFYPVVLKRKH